MSVSSYYFLIKGYEINYVEKILKKIKNPCVLFQASPTFVAFAVNSEYDDCIALHAQLSKQFKTDLILFENFEDFGWGVTILNNDKEAFNFKINYDEITLAIVPTDLTVLEKLIESPSNAQRLYEYIQMWDKIYDTLEIHKGPNLFLSSLGLHDLSEISYDYLIMQSNLESLYEHVILIDPVKTKRLNRKKIFDEIIGNPLKEMGYQYSELWKVRTNSNLFLNKALSFRSGIDFELVSHGGQSGYIEPRLVSPFGTLQFYDLKEGFKKLYIYDNEEEYRQQLHKIFEIFSTYGVGFLQMNHIDNIDIDSIFSTHLEPVIRRLGFTPFDYPRTGRFYNFDLKAFSNDEDILLFEFNYNNAYYTFYIDKMDPNFDISNDQTVVGGKVNGEYRDMPQLMAMIDKTVNYMNSHYSK